MSRTRRTFRLWHPVVLKFVSRQAKGFTVSRASAHKFGSRADALECVARVGRHLLAKYRFAQASEFEVVE